MLESAHRVLVIDDNPWIHDDVRKVLVHPNEDSWLDKLDRLDRELTGGTDLPSRPVHLRFEIDSALQGREGVEAVRRARGDGRPYALAFVDIRMPPGWDGIQTIERLWEADPEVQVVICSAYSDYSWSAIERRIGGTDRLLVLKKPFEAIEVSQLAHTLARKWSLQRSEIIARTAELARAGRLAAGIADELASPTREVGDTLRRLRAELEEIELELEATAIPATLEDAFGGLGQIARIIRAAKEFGKDDGGEPSSVDLNAALLATLEVARHEYRAVADVEAELGELPRVVCVGSEINLVFLNLIMNAAHVIGDAAAGTGRRGTIRIRTWTDGGDALISVANSGTGTPLRMRNGQGLAIARALIVKHGGTLTFETGADLGALLTVRLPISRARPET
jgi:two-component system, NtrC family, sensor kinase